MTKNIFYVYAYLRDKDSKTAKIGTPYYIGKGKGNRITRDHKKIPVPTKEENILIVAEGLTELWSLAFERQLIRWYGRKDLGTGILLNKTDGGDGVSGIIQSATTRQKRSDALTGRKQPNISAALKGIPKSAEHNAKNSASKLGVKKPKIAEALAGKQNKLGKTNKNPYPLKGLPKPKISCKHCGFMASIPSIARYHNNNCKKKETV